MIKVATGIFMKESGSSYFDPESGLISNIRGSATQPKVFSPKIDEGAAWIQRRAAQAAAAKKMNLLGAGATQATKAVEPAAGGFISLLRKLPGLVMKKRVG